MSPTGEVIVVVGEIIRGAIEGIAGAVREGRRTHSPNAVMSPINNYYFVDAQGPITPSQVLVPSDIPADQVIPSTLHVEFASSEEDVGWFEIDQPAMVLVFALETDDEVTLGIRLSDELAVDVAPGLYGILTVVYLDDDLDTVDGIGFLALEVEDWAYDVYATVEVFEVDEEEAEAFVDEVDQALTDIFG